MKVRCQGQVLLPGEKRQGWLKMFLGILNTQKPLWLDGVVFGPQVDPLMDDKSTEFSKDIFKMGEVSLEQYVGNFNWMRDRMSWFQNNMFGLT